jgi:hypothetical protein
VRDDVSGVAAVTMRVRNVLSSGVAGTFKMGQSGNTWSFEIESTLLDVGRYTYEFRAIDKAGNTAPDLTNKLFTFDVFTECGSGF